ncbi:MAG TPA: condensation domain-containing protein, partial [Micromonosporaceae bacterium]
MDSVDSRSGSSLWVPASRSGPADRSGHIPLSFQQEFLRLVDKGDQAGPFGPRYTIVGGWRLRGPLDLPALRAAFADLVVRHEALRTTIVRSTTEAYQVVHLPREPEFQVWDLASSGPGHRDGRAEEFLNELGATTVDAGEVPQLRAVLGRFDQRDAVLVLAAHHTAVDGWSIQVLMRDLASLYSARRRGFQADLPPARQYQEYVAWQRANAADPAVVAAKEYWRGRLDGARVLPVRTDRPRRPDDPGSVTSWYRFLIPDELRTATTELASQLRSST